MTGTVASARNRTAEAKEIRQLEVEIRKELRGRLAALSIEVRDGGLILRGSSRTFYAKQLAQHAVMKGTRLPILRNAIEVASRRCEPARPAATSTASGPNTESDRCA